MDKIIGYARQSIDKKKIENSVKSQIKAIQAYTNKHHLQDVTFLSDVKSGRTTTRDGYQSMLEMIQNNECQHIIVFRINRLNRNYHDFLEFQELCETHQVLITSLCDGHFDLSDKTQAFKIRFLAILGETESKIISENVRSANALKAKNHQLLGTNAPFGYIYKNKSFHIDSSKVTTIKFVFNSYIQQGWGYKKISQALNNHIELFDRTPKQVKRILTNEKYAGLIRNQFGEYKGTFQPIIDEAIFRQAETIRVSKQTLKHQHPMVLLRKKIKCICGATMTPIRMKRKHMTHPITYYICPLNENVGYKKCDMGYLVASEIDQQTIDIIEDNILTKPTLQCLESMVQKRLATNINRSKPNFSKATLIEELSKKQISIEDYKMKINELEIWQYKMNYYQQSNSDINVHKITKNILNNYTLYLDQLTEMITRVTVDQDKNITGVFLKDYPINLLKEKDDINVVSKTK